MQEVTLVVFVMLNDVVPTGAVSHVSAAEVLSAATPKEVAALIDQIKAEHIPAVFVEQAYSNHFSDALRLRFTGGKGLDYNKELFATFAYMMNRMKEGVVGDERGLSLVSAALASLAA